MTVKQIAHKIGFHPNALSMYLTNYRPIRSKAAKKIAAYLNQEDWRQFIEMPGHELRALLTQTT